MEEVARKDGLRTLYLRVASQPTGKCAVLVVDGERSLVASLGAAEHYSLEHARANWAVVESARVFYISSFFMTHSAAVILAVARHSAEAQKRFVMNLAAPFIVQVPPFKAALMEAMPYIDVLVGNESEAAAFAASEGWPAELPLAEVARRICGLPKASGHCGRTVVITQGAEATLVATGGRVTSYPVIPLAKEQLVDTNGAGDAFVGGLLSQLVAGKGWAECCRAGNYAANTVIQRSGCTFPEAPEFQWA
jgi:adenosine kinase